MLTTKREFTECLYLDYTARIRANASNLNMQTRLGQYVLYGICSRSMYVKHSDHVCEPMGSRTRTDGTTYVERIFVTRKIHKSSIENYLMEPCLTIKSKRLCKVNSRIFILE